MPEPTGMGLGFGLENPRTVFKQRNRWLIRIDQVAGSEDGGGIKILPPSRSARPSISFREIQIEHLEETIFFPGKPEWKPITVTLYDIDPSRPESEPVFNWISKFYDISALPNAAGQGNIIFPPIKRAGTLNSFKREVTLELLDGCGSVIERWVYQNAWPQSVEWQELDMASSEVLMVEITLRYDRAYLIQPDCE